MSQTEIERFVTAVETTPALIETYRTAADAADLAARLRADGYDVTEAEITAGIAELSDEELDDVAGGSSAAERMAKFDRYGIAGALFTLGRINGISFP